MQKNENLIGVSDSFLAVIAQVSRLAPLNKPVLIIGERGSGKELIAKRLHYLSHRWQSPLITLNCAALNESLLDSELFGHEAGSFTGAQKRHLGRFERAQGGSLFLDELANAPLRVQEKLLRVIEYGEYERVGGNQPLFADVRLICATNEDLPQKAQQGTFRADLLDRLAFDVINIPPLRQRQEDIPLLADFFAVEMCKELGHAFFAGFSAKAQQALCEYSWPGNIRELKNVVERAVYRNPNPHHLVEQIIFNPFLPLNTITLPEKRTILPTPYLEDQPLSLKFPLNLKQWLAQQEQYALTAAMQQTRYNQKQAAVLLGITYHQLRGMLRKYPTLFITQKSTEIQPKVGVQQE
ncbi:MAG: phage shock protein operon transcriptional activator [Plesiomonas sp.]|uniref:phage shock protein operon transcriptional activator n=1 Tax=Plesiomonas sp. TaxID=2486279 RepID=UPI003F379CE1